MNAIRTTLDFFGKDWVLGRSVKLYYFYTADTYFHAPTPEKLWAKISAVIKTTGFRKEIKMKAKKPAKKAKKVIKKKKK